MSVTLEAELEMLRKERDELAKQWGEEIAETQRLKKALKRCLTVADFYAEKCDGAVGLSLRGLRDFLIEIGVK